MLLVQAAEEAIEPLEVRINKPELKRLLEREAVKKEKDGESRAA